MHLTGPSANRTLMIVNVNPSVADFDETQHVLAYATAARTVQVSQDEVHRNRKELGGDSEATHDYNGRALKRFKTSKEGSSDGRGKTKQDLPNWSNTFLQKKLASKRVMTSQLGAASKVSRRAETTSNVEAANKDSRKRKMENSKSGSSTSLASSDAEPNPKMARLANMRAQGKRKNDAFQLSGFNDKELKQLKTSLSIAQAEAEVLRSEKSHLPTNQGDASGHKAP